MEPVTLVIAGLITSAVSGFETLKYVRRKAEVVEKKKELEQQQDHDIKKLNRQHDQQQERDDKNRQFEIEKLNRQENLENKKLLVSVIVTLISLVPAVLTLLKPSTYPASLVRESQLITVIQDANDADALAKSTLDSSHLYIFYTGESLEDIKAQIGRLRAKGLYGVSSLKSQRFDSFKVSKDGLSAEVRVVEKWKSTLRRVRNEHCFKVVFSTLPQTYYLQYVENRWKVSRIVFDPSGTSEESQCQWMPGTIPIE